MTNDKDHPAAKVLHLVTFVDTDDAVIDTRRISVSASHWALLDTGTWVVLINDRGWCRWGPRTLWSETTAERIRATARAVVGPLTPLDGVPHPDLEYEHWTHLAKILHEHGANADPHDLPHLPHHVVLSDCLQKRFKSTARDTPPPGQEDHAHIPRKPQNAPPKDTTTEHDPPFRTVPGNHHFRTGV